MDYLNKRRMIMTKTGEKHISLWKDTFTIHASIDNRPLDEIKETFQFEGSLKGAIRYLLNDYRRQKKGNICAVIHNSNGDYLKEIGF